MKLKGRTALITGAARGLGAEIARELGQQGANVAFTYLEDKKSAQRLTRELKDLGRDGLSFQADAKDFRRAADVVRRIERSWSRIDVLVCCAGEARSVPIVQMSETDWDDVMSLTLKGAFNYVRAVSPLFVEHQFGRIICIGSINGLRGRPGTLSYNVAKAALSGLIKTAAAELGRHGVTANLVAPGFLETTTQVNTSELIRQLVIKECAIPRLGQPQDVAPLVAFLSSDAASHITGQIIKVDAGQYL